jgi:hypothetical protein
MEKTLPKPVYEPTDQGSLNAFKYYKKMLERKQFKAVDHTQLENGDTTNPEHLLWMCNYCIPRVRDDGLGFPVDKYSRWLGFIQGCLISQGYTTVESEKYRTLSWYKK